MNRLIKKISNLFNHVSKTHFSQQKNFYLSTQKFTNPKISQSYHEMIAWSALLLLTIAHDLLLK